MENEDFLKSRQKLMRHLRIVDNIILMLKAPYKVPRGFEHVKGYSKEGIALEDIKRFPRYFSIAKDCYTCLRSVRGGPPDWACAHRAGR